MKYIKYNKYEIYNQNKILYNIKYKTYNKISIFATFQQPYLITCSATATFNERV